MRLFGLAVIGLLFQILGIAAFAEVSQTSIGVLGKLIIIALDAIFIMILLWISFQVVSLRSSLFYLPALLALGYIVAFHVVGIMAFHGLLSDLSLSLSYFMSLFRVGVVAFALFATIAVVLFFIKSTLDKRNGLPKN